MNGVAPLHSGARKCTKKMLIASLKIHLLLRFARWNFAHDINMVKYDDIPDLERNRRDRPTCNNLIPEFPKKVSISQKYYCRIDLNHV